MLEYMPQIFWLNVVEKRVSYCYFLKHGMLPGGVFHGAALTPPWGMVESIRDNHQFFG